MEPLLLSQLSTIFCHVVAFRNEYNSRHPTPAQDALSNTFADIRKIFITRHILGGLGARISGFPDLLQAELRRVLAHLTVKEITVFQISSSAKDLRYKLEYVSPTNIEERVEFEIVCSGDHRSYVYTELKMDGVLILKKRAISITDAQTRRLRQVLELEHTDTEQVSSECILFSD
eukprot:c20455_g1_i6.p1 GENE.c20455_g1_i6~~c20455_g1_i6.p1  ORF type:complete len:175 (+),score=27.52 c20455_g1_i6:424-948(+)